MNNLISKIYMPNLKLHFLKTGMLTLIQDNGRQGFQYYGIPSGGALDKTSMYIANWLVGNPIHNPVLEITMIGPQIKIGGACQIAITGADISPMLNGQPLPMNETQKLTDSDVISFGKLKKGCRAYLSVGGKWCLENWLNSSSASAYNGNEIIPDGLIKKGQTIEIEANAFIQKRTSSEVIDHLFSKRKIQVLPGPEFELFPRTFIGHFFSRSFRISNDSNRMGYRLENSIEGLVLQKELISSGTLPGTIQITNDGQPIVLLADAQTTGGYHRIANVITSDIDRLAQLKPGDEIGFELVDVDTAYIALDKKNKILDILSGQ